MRPTLDTRRDVAPLATTTKVDLRKAHLRGDELARRIEQDGGSLRRPSVGVFGTVLNGLTLGAFSRNGRFGMALSAVLVALVVAANAGAQNNTEVIAKGDKPSPEGRPNPGRPIEGDKAASAKAKASSLVELKAPVGTFKPAPSDLLRPPSDFMGKAPVIALGNGDKKTRTIDRTANIPDKAVNIDGKKVTSIEAAVPKNANLDNPTQFTGGLDPRTLANANGAYRPATHAIEITDKDSDGGNPHARVGTFSSNIVLDTANKPTDATVAETWTAQKGAPYSLVSNITIDPKATNEGDAILRRQIGSARMLAQGTGCNKGAYSYEKLVVDETLEGVGGTFSGKYDYEAHIQVEVTSGSMVKHQAGALSISGRYNPKTKQIEGFSAEYTERANAIDANTSRLAGAVLQGEARPPVTNSSDLPRGNAKPIDRLNDDSWISLHTGTTPGVSPRFPFVSNAESATVFGVPAKIAAKNKVVDGKDGAGALLSVDASGVTVVSIIGRDGKTVATFKAADLVKDNPKAADALKQAAGLIGAMKGLNY